MDAKIIDIPGMDEALAMFEANTEALADVEQYTAKHSEVNDDFPVEDILAYAEENQAGAASLFIKLARGKFLLDKTCGQWYRLIDGVWTRDIVEEVAATLKKEVQLAFTSAGLILASKAQKAPDSDTRKELKKQVQTLIDASQRLNKRSYQQDVLVLSAQGDDSLAYDGAGWDSVPYALPCKNGLLDLRKIGEPGAFRPLDPTDLIRATTNVDYIPEAKCPIWERFLLTTFDGNRDIVRHVQKVIGYATTKDPREDKLFILHGRGRNGKSVLIETVLAVLGKLAATIQPELLLDQGRARSSQAASPDLLQLQGKGLCTTSELNEGCRIDASRVKFLTGRDTVTARPLYGKGYIEFRPTHVFVMLTNFLPHANSDDYALWKRIQAVPFTLSFVEHPQEPHERKIDRSLSAKFVPEYSGILNWIIDGASLWQKEGLDNPPATIVSATAQYQREEDVLQDFIDEICTVVPGKFEKCAVLYNAYVTWHERGNHKKKMSLKDFGKKLKERFYYEEKRHVKFYELVIKTEQE